MALGALFEDVEEPSVRHTLTVRECDLWVVDVETPVGLLRAAANNEALVMLEYLDDDRAIHHLGSLSRFLVGAVFPTGNAVLEQLTRELGEYFAGHRREFNVPLELHGTDFQERVWNHLLTIGYGWTSTYLQVAEAVATKEATRAVGKANGDNRLAIVVPCHRVIRADGHLCGYGGGLWRKQFLLALEAGQPLLL